MRRLRILGLHGYAGSAELLRRQLRPLASSLDALADVVCVDAPSLADGDFGWWHASEGAAVRYRGWTRTHDWLSACGALHGAFDGVLGFSQGAALAALLVALCAFDSAAQSRLDFAMIVGGFASRDERHAALFETPVFLKDYEAARAELRGVLGLSEPVIASQPNASNDVTGSAAPQKPK